VLSGGNSGPAVVPGKPGESLLVDAINYGDIVQMPPKSKLPKGEIEALTRWVERGAPWPATDVARKPAMSPGGGIDLAERAKHWSFRPIRDPRPPDVKESSWPLGPIDRFLLAALEARKIAPAPEADRRTLVRRVTFDLTGLPPTPVEVESFVRDDSPRAYERLVDRLLASPRYGERWARHWLDLVRFGETAGHEFDYDTLDAWRYRDYVIRAFNEDVPYNQFVVEHLAGDLIDSPRRSADGSNESILGTGFFLLGEGTHSPVDVRDDAAARVDNQLDVLGKAFLGMTVACARCHDHKFDPIRQADYYALVGFLRSSRHQHAFIDPPGRLAPKLDALKTSKERIASGVRRGESDGVADAIAPADLKAADAPPLVRAIAAAAESAPGDFADRRRAAIDAIRARKEDDSLLFEDFNSPTFDGWTSSGDAFGAGPSRPGELRIGAGGVAPVVAGLAHSGLIADRLQGVLRSKTFTIEARYILYRAGGRGGRVNVVVDGFEKIRDPIYGVLTFGVDHGDALRWIVQDVGMWIGHRAYIELADGATVNYNGARSSYFPGDGYLAVDEIRFADRPTPPAPGGRLALEVLEASHSPTDLLSRLAREGSEALRAWREGRGDDPERAELVSWLVATGRAGLGAPPSGAFESYRALAESIPPPTLAPALIDGTGEDARLQIRGSTKTLGPVVPRRFFEVFAGPSPPSAGRGSGRLDVARRMVDPANPLVARVLVNRLWKHHFGDGLVTTPDDFGRMGRPPSNPDLLDWLATEFVRGRWSIKHMQRLVVTSRAYRMSSRPEPQAERLDPANVLLHRMNVRRLEAEAIRDAMLAVSGRLDPKAFGPSVPVHLTPFMDGRGRPPRSGPLDGDGRRSLYLNIRRNFLPPMLLAFDFPPPATAMGRRNVSNVPAQALTLLNDPLVRDQARRWADRVLAGGPASPEVRVARLYLAAFSRPPEPREAAAALAFLSSRGRDDPAAWAELCHVLMNVKEFIFIN
jgi:hypothetical protein